MDFSALRFEKANVDQAQAISDLINLTYRGNAGWTTEAAIIQGDRTNRQEIETAMQNSGAHFFVINLPSMLASCIYVAREEERAYIGFFSVHPDLQGQGLGKYMLEQAETFASSVMNVHQFVMFVISQRTELVEFYQRRGYYCTGRIETYPAYLGTPKIAGLTIEYLEKKDTRC
ncbi:GNAT family N-acetyltransferase [Nitrosomonas sp. Is35]|uniref:GNAT family N-acetyltransferase n=1 Tax=unclassified Nitrosomonas TaxID=2609265 RepID=UPI00294B3637|nr:MULTISPECIES: GNAT family N-acetyltransferase [unclassified Nitrosomonas]MDV6341517.1 GNAT family N-acetyltransferase [Nitrosomonas sp. Is24]MDV6347244.1 GNAT family N-acetyltransferase [Nitrosomonas sp. Is35]